MSKKVVVVCGSPRIGGNSEILADAFIRGAKAAGHSVKKIRLAEKKVLPCLGCSYCSDNNLPCILEDDMNGLYPEILGADVVVMASPVYYFGFSAQLKAFIDRLYGPDVKGNIFSAENSYLPHKECALLMTAAEKNKEVFDLPVMHFQQIFSRWFMWANRGMVLVSGVSESGDIKGHEKLNDAYDIGRNL